MKDFEKVYRETGPYHHVIGGFSRWWTYDNYRILASWVGKRESVLDLACGDGALWPFLETRNIVGLDSAPTGLRHAKTFGAFSLVQADMTALPFKASVFDTAVCSLSFQYLVKPDLEKSLADLQGIVKRDGRLVLSYPNVKPAGPCDGSHAGLPYQELWDCLRRAGFQLTDIKIVSGRIPNVFFRWSSRPFLKTIAYLYYQISKIVRSGPRRSYHYALCCVNEGPSREGGA